MYWDPWTLGGLPGKLEMLMNFDSVREQVAGGCAVRESDSPVPVRVVVDGGTLLWVRFGPV